MTDSVEYIPRQLSWTDDKGEPTHIDDDELLKTFNDGPLVVLGDPGMGKTKLMERFEASEAIRLTDSDPYDWPTGLDQLIAMGNDDSTRLAI